MGLTREQVLAMEPGPEMNAAVAEFIMGWKWKRFQPPLTEKPTRFLLDRDFEYEDWDKSEDCFIDFDHAFMRHYSTNLVDDFEVHRTASRWIFSKRQAYFKALNEVIQRRVVGGDSDRRYEVCWPDALAHYEIGDFSRAALIASLPGEGEG